MLGPAVEVDHLVMRYRGVTAVAGLSLRAEPGTVTAVVGPNGAGKTTTLETCVGLRAAQEGTVRVLGLDPGDRRHRAALLPRIGVLLQEVGGHPGGRPLQLLRHAAALYAHPHDPDELVDLVGLRGGTLRTPYRRLSGGERRRLGLALALIGRPELVFLDEPSAGLDPRGRHAIWALVTELRAAGGTVVLSTHLLDEAERLADQVIIIDRGLVVGAGTPAELAGRGVQKALSFSVPAGLDLDSLRAAIGRPTSVEQPAPGRYQVNGELTPQLLATVTAWCAAHGVLPEALTLHRRSLEDVYLEVTGAERQP
ncbi:MAG TPA: ABC transporter ATP-binding protein [Actinomycetes bacterium]|nr:ABC transporter ATP-binding protein [Actinomycetes bacterium]